MQYKQDNLSSNENDNKKRGKHLFLWILGWIIIFPIPLTILLKRNNKLNKPTKIIIIIIAWCAFIALGNIAQLSKKDIQSVNNSAANGYISSSVDSKTQSEYAKDPVVNRFITEFNEKYPNTRITDINKGNIRTKYFGRIDGCGIEMINATEAAGYLSIKISGGDTIEGQEKMFDVFKKIVQVVDQTISNNEIDETISYLKPQKYVTENSSNIQVGKNISINYFPLIPDANSGTRIDMHIYNYK